jgi:sulfite reductase alpha subunit-like flavoprotein
MSEALTSAILQQQHQQVKKTAWLIWGDKHRVSDFLYDDELNAFALKIFIVQFCI